MRLTTVRPTCGASGDVHSDEEPCTGPASEHECPYQADVWDNHEPYCTCCEGCTRRCAENI